MNKHLILLLTCALSLNLYSQDNKALGEAIAKADLIAFNNLFANNQATVDDTVKIKAYNEPILTYAVSEYIFARHSDLARIKDLKKMIEFLIKNGAPNNSKNAQGNAPLDYLIHALMDRNEFWESADAEQFEDLILLLLKYGADINIQNDFHLTTPLHGVTRMPGSPKTVAFLLKNGAKTDIKNKKGLTAYEIAEQNASKGHENAIKIKAIFDTYKMRGGLQNVHQAEKEKPTKSLKDLGFRFE